MENMAKNGACNIHRERLLKACEKYPVMKIEGRK